MSRILDCSVEGPRGAKPGEGGRVDAVGDGGRDAPLPSPGVSVSFRRLVRTQSSMCACLVGTRPAANRRVSRSPCQRYLIVRLRASPLRVPSLRLAGVTGDESVGSVAVKHGAGVKPAANVKVKVSVKGRLTLAASDPGNECGVVNM